MPPNSFPGDESLDLYIKNHPADSLPDLRVLNQRLSIAPGFLAELNEIHQHPFMSRWIARSAALEFKGGHGMVEAPVEFSQEVFLMDSYIHIKNIDLGAEAHGSWAW